MKTFWCNGGESEKVSGGESPRVGRVGVPVDLFGT